ncbi:MAG: O-antigen ligase family protein [Bacteroidetes bacterium]|nr:O-antigen ligase family protein [Bacteroidota bacterium]
MKDKKSPFFLVSVLIVAMFAFSCVIPTITVLSTGAKSITTLSEALLAFSPDILFLAAVCFGSYIYITKKDLRFEWQFFDSVVSLFLVFNLIYGFALSDKDKLALLSVRITYLPVAFYFLARLFNARTIEQNKKLLHSVFSVYVILALIGLILYFIFPKTNEYIVTITGKPLAQYFITRMGSLYLTPVLFATAMAFTLIYFYQKYIQSNSYKDLFIYLMLWLCLVLSVSRGPMMSFGLAFVILLLIYKKYKLSFISGIGMLLVLLAVSFYATQNLDFIKWLFYSSAKTINMDNDVSRVNRWQVTFENFLAQPFGYGFGKTGAVAFTHLIDKPNIKAAVYSTDGWYLKMACENGVPGLLTYLSLAGILLNTLIKKIKENKNQIALLALGLFIVVHVQSLFSNVLDFFPLIALYWFVAGLAINSYKKDEA